MKSRVTVLMPCFNAERYLRESISSLQRQTFRDFELIVIDDASTDDSAAILSEIAASDPRIVVFRNNENLGLASTRNVAIENARGEFVAWLDADDIAMPERLELQVRFLDGHPTFGTVGSWVAEIDSAGAPNGRRWILNAPAEEVPALMLFRCYCAQSAVMLRRSLLGHHRYDEMYPPAEDYEFNARLSREAPFWNLSEILCLYRRHRESTSAIQSERAVQSLKLLFRTRLGELGIDPTEEEMQTHLAMFNVETRSQARQHAVEKWLLRLLRANDERKIYDRRSFSRVIVSQWFYACWAFDETAVRKGRIFFGSSVLRQARLTMSDWFSLFRHNLERWRFGTGRTQIT